MNGWFPRVRRTYKTRGFAPRVSYIAFLPSHLQPPPPIASASRIHISTIVELASSHPHLPMDPWCRSDFIFQRLEGLIHHDLLCARTAAKEWLLPGEEDVPSQLIGYVVSFTHFHEQGFATPAHRFLRGLLHYYQIELQHLNPNGV